MKIDYVLLACDDSATFLSFLPSVSYHWRSMGYRVAFGLVSRVPPSSEEEARLRSYCDDVYVHVVPEGCSYSMVAMSKLFRFYLARHYSDSVVCVQDIDYYVFDRNAHIEREIRSPSTEILTYGYNAYYKPFATPQSRVLSMICYGVTPGLPPTALIYGTDQQVYLNTLKPGRLIQKKLSTPVTIRVPATPTVATGSLVYRMLGASPDASFAEVLDGLHALSRSFPPPPTGVNPPDLTSTAFSDETLFSYLNALTKVPYRHIARDDFVNGTADLRIDPRKSDDPTQWFPRANGRSLHELLLKKYFVDIQPNRPLEDSPLMRKVFDVLDIPSSLLQQEVVLDCSCEFGYELQLVLPYAYYLHQRGVPVKTVSAHDTAALYYFSSKHTEAYSKRTDSVQTLRTPNTSLCWKTFDYSQWVCPPLRTVYANDIFVYDKPLLVITNKYTDEWSGPPVNYLSLEALDTLFGMLSKMYTVVYNRPTQSQIVADESEEVAFHDAAVLTKHPAVRTLRSLSSDYSYNHLQLLVYANCKAFISVQGGSSILASFFGGVNIVYAVKGVEVDTPGTYTEHYPRFSGATVRHASTYEDLLVLVRASFCETKE